MSQLRLLPPEYPPGNTQLVESGITTEESDYRAHVDVEGPVVIVFRTASAREQLMTGKYIPYDIKPSWAPLGMITARGIRIPYVEIPGAWIVEIPTDLLRGDRKQNTSEKGRWAERIYDEIYARGLIVLPQERIKDKNHQIKGRDFRSLVVQVKFDGGALRRGVFLQTHECNPFKAY